MLIYNIQESIFLLSKIYVEFVDFINIAYLKNLTKLLLKKKINKTEQKTGNILNLNSRA